VFTLRSLDGFARRAAYRTRLATAITNPVIHAAKQTNNTTSVRTAVMFDASPIRKS